MHNVCIIHWSEAATEKCFLKIDVTDFWKYKEIYLIQNSHTVLKNTCEGLQYFRMEINQNIYIENVFIY